MRLVDFLDQSSALSYPEALEAKFFDLENNIDFSYSEMVNASIHLANILDQKGVKAQDIVATYTPNSVAAYCCIFAISRLGAVWLPLNTKNTFDANLKLIRLSNADFLFIDKRFDKKITVLLNELGSENIAYLETNKIADITFSSLKKKAENTFQTTTYPLKEYNSVNESLDSNLKELVSLFPTGGTTGDQKLAEWRADTWEAIVDIQKKQMTVTDIRPCYLISAAMTHAAGIGSFSTVKEGGSILVMDDFSPEKILSAIQKYNVTTLFLPPTAIYMLLDFEDIRSYDYGSLRYFWYAAAPMSIDKLKEAISVFGPVMVQTYGQAEAPMICTFFSAEDHMKALNKNDLSILGSCGKASPDIEIAVLSESGDPLPPGSKGEVAIKGRLLMNKYFNNVEATKSIRINGWQLTGDMGIFDEEGYLSLVDRKGDMIITGGFNVYPGEIEQLIWGIPAIKDCAVIGIPHEKWGEQVTAIIELKDNNKAPEESEVINLCKKQLGSVKAPKKVIIIDELPRSPVGKVLKKDLRAVFWKNEKRKI
jgi:acyl-CoA synthetase (AMP-forming)/AMP-acid ligase II